MGGNAEILSELVATCLVHFQIPEYRNLWVDFQ